MLTSKQRAYLRGLASKEDVVLIIGKEGMTENVFSQAELAIKPRELIKIKVLESAMLTPQEAAAQLCERLKAECVQTIGSKAVLYRRNNEKPVIELK